MSDPGGDAFDESGIFNASLSMWRGIIQGSEGEIQYEDNSFEPIPLDLHTSASIGENEVVQDILDRKHAKINTLNRGGWSALMYASYMGHENTIHLLLEMGADTNQRTPRGSTSLILAAMCGYDSVMPSLLQNGADLEAKDNRGWTALFHAASSGHQQTTEFLIKAGANLEVVEPSHHLTPVMEAAASGHEIIVQQLLQRGVDISRVDSNGDSARTLAYEYGHLEVANLIDDFKHTSRTSSSSRGQNSHQKRNSQKNQPHSGNHGSSGPSIHDGPKAFAQITGLGADGKPKPGAATPLFLQEPSPQPPVQPDTRHFESRWTGPKDLASLLEEIGCSKHMPVFKEQDIDLRIFLTLTEEELKEIGVKLFGPRRKMVATIGRINSSIKASIIDKTELSYCDSLLLKMKNLEASLKESQDNVIEVTAQLAQERQLRSVTEGVLMEREEARSVIQRYTEKVTGEHGRLVRIADQIRTFCARNNQSKSRHQSNHGAPPPNNSRMIDQEFPKLSQDFDTALHHTRDYLVEMQRLLQMQRSGSLAAGKTDQWKDRG